MFIKLRTEFFQKNLFLLLIAVSLAIHALIIFMSPQANQILSLRSLRDSFIREPSEYAVILELENTDARIENSLDSNAKQDESEPKKDEDAEKKKYKIFTDTSDNTEDEETSVDTDKIGEKGSVAKDYFPDDKQPVNNDPHAEGHSKAPLLGQGKAGAPYYSRQQPQEQEVTEQAIIPVEGIHDRNSPPRYAKLPKGLEKQESPPMKPLQMVHPQMPSDEKKENMAEVKTVKLDKTIKTEEDITHVSKRERLTIGHSTRHEETEPLPDSEGVLFADKQDEVNREAETKEDALSSLKEHEAGEKTDAETKDIANAKETKNTHMLQPETPSVPPSELSGIESQRRLKRGLDEQESPGETSSPKVSFNVNAKKEGTNNDPVLFEDTISNAAIPGAPSFNVKKHAYADYFKHIRDRISLYWFLGYGTRAEIKLETRDGKPVIVEFKVLPDGSIDGVKIVDDAGNFNLASRLVSSIKNAAPLNPFPPPIKEPSVDVRFNFYFF